MYAIAAYIAIEKPQLKPSTNGIPKSAPAALFFFYLWYVVPLRVRSITS